MLNLAHIILMAANIAAVSDASGGTVAQPGTTASYTDAKFAAEACETETSWVENLGYPAADGPYRGVCGDAEGNELVLAAGPLNTCEQYAELRYAMAESAGAVADAAWEDAWASCKGAR